MKGPWDDLTEAIAKAINEHVGKRVWPEIWVRSVRESHLTGHVRITLGLRADVPHEAERARLQKEEQA